MSTSDVDIYWYNKDVRKDTLVNGQIYHILTRSIAGFKVFSSSANSLRFFKTLSYYKNTLVDLSFSRYNSSSEKNQQKYLKLNNIRVQIISYCLMPTHIHLILKQIHDDGISLFMKDILNSFTKFFNIKYNRRGPLWESRFKNVLVKNDEQLLHLTRYIHLNPVSAGLAKLPENWKYSSYHEYLGRVDNKICDWAGSMEIDSRKYQKFVNDRIRYQKELSKLKHLLFEDYFG